MPSPARLWVVGLCLLLGLSLGGRAAPLVRDPDVLGGKLLQVMLQDIEAVPTVNAQATRLEQLPAFSATLLKEYLQEDAAPSQLGDQVGKGAEVIRKALPSLPREFRTKNIDALRDVALQVQKVLAIAGLEVDEALEALKEVDAAARQAETRNGRARYDYVLARLLEYRAFILEFQFQLAEIRADRLPLPIDNPPAWRLVPQAKVQCRAAEGKQAKRLAQEARTLLDRIVAEHAGTPWAYFASQETVLGLRWELLPDK